jgi:hypothetical protein
MSFHFSGFLKIFLSEFIWDDIISIVQIGIAKWSLPKLKFYLPKDFV